MKPKKKPKDSMKEAMKILDQYYEGTEPRSMKEQGCSCEHKDYDDK